MSALRGGVSRIYLAYGVKVFTMTRSESRNFVQPYFTDRAPRSAIAPIKVREASRSTLRNERNYRNNARTPRPRLAIK